MTADNEDANVYYYSTTDGQVNQTTVVACYGTCWICKGTSGRLIVAFDLAQRRNTRDDGYPNLCADCIPTAKTLAALCGWRKP